MVAYKRKVDVTFILDELDLHMTLAFKYILPE